MLSSVFLVLSLVFIIIVFRQDSKEWIPFSRELWILLLWLVLSSTRLLPVLFPYRSAYDASELLDAYIQGNPINRIVFTTLIFIAFLMLIKRRSEYSFPIKKNIWLFALYFYALCSLGWSNFAGASIKKWVQIVGSLFMALILLTEDKYGEAFEHVFRRFSCIVITLSVLLVKYYKNIGFVLGRHGTRNWAGIATHKNELGKLCALALLFLVWRYLKGRRRINILDAMLMFMGLYLLYRAGSVTSIILFLLGLVLLVAMTALKNNFKKIIPLTIVSSLVVTLLLPFLASYSRPTNSNLLFRLIGRDSTFTGRVPLWSDLIKMGSKEIMIGAGYESFWPANLTRIWEKYSFGPNNAHNGYIDVYLDLGILGIILLFILIAKTFSKLAIQIKVSDQYGRLFLIFFIMILIHNVTESSLMKSSLIWFLFLVFSINVVKHPFATGTEEEIRELA